MTDSPLVSVLMTAYNREKYIAEAIESVLSASYKNIELIIVDDVSTDKTVSIAQKYAQEDNRIKLYVNPQNLGDYPNRNRAIGYAKGKYIMFVDSDDKSLPNGIERCVKAMEQFPEASFGMHDNTHDNQMPYILNSLTALQKHFFEQAFLFIGPGGTIIKRDFIEQLGLYPTKYGPANDMYFNLKAVTTSALVMLPFHFIFYRRHDGQEINNTYGYLSSNYRYLRDALVEIHLPITSEQKAWIAKKNKRRFVVNIIKYFLKTNNFTKTKAAIKAANFTIRDAFSGIFQFN